MARPLVWSAAVTLLIDELLVLSVVPVGAEIRESGRRVNGRRSRSREARDGLQGRH